MRKLLTILAVALLSAYLPPAMQTSAAPIGEPTATSDSTVVAAKKGKKKNKKSKNKLKVALDEIESPKKGRRDLEITARLTNDKGKIDYRCRLIITYADGTMDEPDDVVVDHKDVCTHTIDVPNDSAVVGEAEAELIVLNESGKEKGKATQKFEVRSGS